MQWCHVYQMQLDGFHYLLTSFVTSFCKGFIICILIIYSITCYKQFLEQKLWAKALIKSFDRKRPIHVYTRTGTLYLLQDTRFNYQSSVISGGTFGDTFWSQYKWAGDIITLSHDTSVSLNRRAHGRGQPCCKAPPASQVVQVRIAIKRCWCIVW